MARKSTTIILSLIVAAVFLAAAGGTTVADPVQDKQSELERIKNEVQSIDSQLETVTEQYNLTSLRVDQAQASIAEKERQLAELTAALEQRKGILGERMRELYKSGNTDVLEVITECRTVDDLFTNVDRAQRISGSDVEIITSVMASREGVNAARQELEAQKAELDSTVAELGAQKEQIEASLQQRKNTMAGVESEVNALIAQEASQQPAVQPKPPARPIPPPPPAPSYAPEVVKVAYAQLGKPYQYAGSGPNVFDCSGLVMYCYAQVGVSLPHSSYMQARCGVPVSYSDLQPGDLVFFHGYGHVGMYIGNGQYIHAPQTGDVVRIADLGRRRDFCGACRIV
jgi:peptidoglycan DL-endopeptidase CwlO